MRRTRQTWIRTEISEKLTIKRVSGRPERLECSSCVGEVSVATLSESKRLSHLSAREIFRQAEHGTIHILESTGDEPMVCLNSLSQACPNPYELRKLLERTTEKGETK